MAAAPPILHILAGPNGAGKTSFYEATLSRLTAAAFVNADRLAEAALGRHSASIEDARRGQALADRRRGELIAQRASLVTESTFSHPSKLDLVRDAQAAGYAVIVYHLGLDSADLAVARVAARVAQGGHPAPEDRIRGRYARNPALIRQAVLMADRGFVFDNSRLGEPPRRLIAFADGRASAVAEDLPAWAADLYGADLSLGAAPRPPRP